MKRILSCLTLLFAFLLAGCSSNANCFTVVFEDYDGTQLYVDFVEYGENAVYRGAPLNRENEGEKEYTFLNWSESTEKVTSNIAVRAVYSEKVAEYSINFVNYDGTLLQFEKLRYGSTPKYRGATPEKPSTNGKGYKFLGWNKEIKSVTKDETYIATFTETNLYVVKYFDDEKFIDLEFVSESSNAKKEFNFPEIIEGDSKKVFKGWDKGRTNVQSDLELHAQYNIEYKKTVNFYDGYGNLIKTFKVFNGESVEYDCGFLSKDDVIIGDYTYTYVFDGWDKSTKNITSDMDVYPVFHTILSNNSYINERDKLIRYVENYGDYGAF